MRYEDHIDDIVVDYDNDHNSKAQVIDQSFQFYKKDFNNNTEDEALPDYKNWFEEGAVTVPYDQGGCGGCWAFSATAALQSLSFISGYSNELREFSVMQLLECVKKNYACKGGWMYEGFEYVAQDGILDKEDYPKFTQRGHQNNCRKDEAYIREHGQL